MRRMKLRNQLFLFHDSTLGIMQKPQRQDYIMYLKCIAKLMTSHIHLGLICHITSKTQRRTSYSDSKNALIQTVMTNAHSHARFVNNFVDVKKNEVSLPITIKQLITRAYMNSHQVCQFQYTKM